VPPPPRSGRPADGQPADGQPVNGHGTGDHALVPGHPATPDYPPMPDYPPAPGHPPTAGYQPMPDYPPTPSYPPPTGYPPTGYLTAPGYPDYPPADAAASAAQPRYARHPPPSAAPGTAQPGHPYPDPVIAHDEYATGEFGPVGNRGHRPGEGGVERHGLAPDEYGVVYDDYGYAPLAAAEPPREARAPSGPAATGPDAVLRSGGSADRWAMLAYLTVPLFGFVIPLWVYLRTLRGSRWARAHAAQALNVWITVIFYDLSAVIMGTSLALDSPQVALIVFGPLIVGLWLVALRHLVRAATAASLGLDYTFPRWLCSRIFR
jgi:hypothetical protein